MLIKTAKLLQLAYYEVLQDATFLNSLIRFVTKVYFKQNYDNNMTITEAKLHTNNIKCQVTLSDFVTRWRLRYIRPM